MGIEAELVIICEQHNTMTWQRLTLNITHKQRTKTGFQHFSVIPNAIATNRAIIAKHFVT